MKKSTCLFCLLFTALCVPSYSDGRPVDSERTGASARQQVFLDFTRTLAEKQIQSNKAAKVKQTSRGLRISVAPGDNGVVSFRPMEKYWDISQWAFVTFEIENKGDNEFRFDSYIFGEGPKLKWGRKERFNWHIGWVKPGEKRIFNCVLFRHASTADDYVHFNDFPGMKGIPDGIILLGWDGTDASRIKSIQLKFPPADHRREVILHSIRGVRPAVPELYKKNPKNFFPFINEYGQYKHGTWPGKITSDEQFKAAIEKEKKDLAAHTGSKEWNRFGGYINGPQLKATGHFRTEKLNGKWWIVDPDGRLFWSAGVNSAGGLKVLTPLEKREHFFEKLPEKDSAFDDVYSKNGSIYNFGEANLLRKYGQEDKEKYLAICLARLKSWGLNTMGGWSNDRVGEHPENIRIPYTAIINAISPEIGEKFPDVFDSRWKNNVRRMVKEKAATLKNDPFFFGFFINNEITWDHPMGLAVKTLKKGPNSAGKRAYVSLLRKKLGDIAVFNKKTEGRFSSWQELLNTKVEEKLKMVGVKELNIEHYRRMCEQYFKVTAEAIKEFAPGKMYLGCRWHGSHGNEYNIAAAAKYLDILSFNLYENEIENFDYPGSAKKVDKPFIATEFNFGALDRGKFFTGLGYASDQRNRGEKYRHYVQGAMRNPKCVGTHWFMWGNSTTAGRGNGENANCGLVSATDQIYYELIDFLRETNYSMYDYRVNSQ